MRGRKPKPMEAPLSAGHPVMPNDLGKHGEECWHLVIGNLPSGAVGAIDGPALEGMCRYYQKWRTAIRAKGDPYKNMIIASSAWKHFKEMACRFGMTPADRGRLKMYAKPEDIEDPILKYVS